MFYKCTAAAILLWTTNVYAHDIDLVGKIHQPIPSSTQKSMKAQGNSITPSVTVMKLHLSPSAWTALQTKLQSVTHPQSQQTIAAEHHATGSVQLGMNNVPVLDQGPHSTCVTFASTAAIGAALNQGDYISELCQLALGRYLEENAYTYSGWDGSFGPVVLNQMQTFGIVSKKTQREKGCGGYTEYPTRTSEEPQTRLSPVDYHALTEPTPRGQSQIAWWPIVDVYRIFVDHVDANHTLEQVIEALNAGDRLTFGALLVRMDQGIAGAVGKHHTANDSWVLTPEIIDEINNPQGDIGGHEMIITGYDHQAIAIDNHGNTHRGLLTLRNSWGDKIGNQGDFYMSYDYFKALTMEVQRIRSGTSGQENP